MTVLRQRMTDDMQVRNLSPHTQASYLQQVSLFARYFRTSPDALTPEHIRTYQIYLTNERKLAPNSIHTAVAALRFLYRVTLKKEWTLGEDIPLPKKPQKLPVVLSPEEVVHFLNCVDRGKHQVILTTCYAAGLRISEAFRLKATAIDSARMVVRVAQGKGHKDRYVMLSPKLLDVKSHSIATPFRGQCRPPAGGKSDPSDGAKTGVAEPHIAEQSRSWRAASGERAVMRGS